MINFAARILYFEYFFARTKIYLFKNDKMELFKRLMKGTYIKIEIQTLIFF